MGKHAAVLTFCEKKPQKKFITVCLDLLQYYNICLKRNNAIFATSIYIIKIAFIFHQLQIGGFLLSSLLFSICYQALHSFQGHYHDFHFFIFTNVELKHCCQSILLLVMWQEISEDFIRLTQPQILMSLPCIPTSLNILAVDALAINGLRKGQRSSGFSHIV